MPNNVTKLEKILKDITVYEKQGLDTSYLKSFIKQYKVFLNINNIKSDFLQISDDEKLEIIREIMLDKNIFPAIKDIILFANEEMGVDFKSQNTSRNVTITRIIKRVDKDPELKTKLKKSLLWLIEEKGYSPKKAANPSKEFNNLKDLSKWVNMLKEL